MSETPLTPQMVTKPEYKQVSNYAGALLAVAGITLPYLASPAFLAAIGVPAAAIQLVAGIAGALLVAYREKQPAITTNVQPPVTVTPPNDPTQKGYVDRDLLNLLAFSAGVVLVVVVALSMGACSSLATLVQPSAMPLEQAAVGAAVFAAESADKATPAVQAQRAARINAIAKQILALDSQSSMALTDVELIVNAKIAALGLPAQDALLASILTASLGQAIQAQLAVTSKGAISPTTQIAIADICNWVIADTGG